MQPFWPEQPIIERMPVWECAAGEKRELKDDRPQLRTKDVHRFQELR
jgi:hypothetical protein